MESITLEVTQGVYKTAKEAREAGRVPIVYYGKGIENANFSADYQEFRRAYKKGGKSTIINFIDENKQEFPVLIHEVQYHPVTDEFLHIDVMAVNMDKAIHTEIPLVFFGEAPAIKDLGGVLTHNKDVIAVKCLPKDLVHEIQVDISPLIDFHSSITVGDIKAPQGIEILDVAGINVIGVSAPRAEEEAVVAPAPAEGEEGEKPAEGEADEKKEEK
ncbi:50S ribosomal protein L25 [Candidatus Peregrinibacteria bacterium CG_4_10_14_0_2_um_filter_43_11]|nr:MAG: 50S ribosomal protein L25 [Candidatus Peregrinibacteria bacterium CG_4_10_14_0_2_um_filter_43_11]